MSTRENTRLIARAPFEIIMYFCLHLVFGFIIGNGVDSTEITIIHVPTSKRQSRLQQTTTFVIYFLNFGKTRLDISRESSVRRFT